MHLILCKVIFLHVTNLFALSNHLFVFCRLNCLVILIYLFVIFISVIYPIESNVHDVLFIVGYYLFLMFNFFVRVLVVNIFISSS